MKYKLLVPVIVVSLAFGFFVGTEFQKAQEPDSGLRELINRDSGQPAVVDFSLFWDAWNLIHEKYVDRSELDTQEMVFGAIEGMVKSVGDPFTVFLKEEQSKRLQEDISGEFAGVGIEIGLRDDILTVIAPLKDTPADRAGLRGCRRGPVLGCYRVRHHRGPGMGLLPTQQLLYRCSEHEPGGRKIRFVLR